MLASQKVTTNGSTKFSGVACSAIGKGTKVSGKGASQADGSILASEVDKSGGGSGGGGGSDN